jgi:hypothetical protein
MDILEKQLLDTLYHKFGSMTVNKQTAAEIVGRSRASMDNDRAKGTGIPYFQQGSLGNVKYALHELVKHLVHDSIKTA